MRTNLIQKYDIDRLKVYEVVIATALVCFVSVAVSVSFTFLGARLLVMDSISRMKKGVCADV